MLMSNGSRFRSEQASHRFAARSLWMFASVADEAGGFGIRVSGR
jgi:hypothetical protein